MKSIHSWFVIVSGLVLTGLVVYLSTLGGLTTAIPRFLLVFGFMFSAYIFAVVMILRKNLYGRWLVGYVFLVAVVCRVILLGAAHSQQVNRQRLGYVSVFLVFLVFYFSFLFLFLFLLYC